MKKLTYNEIILSRAKIINPKAFQNLISTENNKFIALDPIQNLEIKKAINLAEKITESDKENNILLILNSDYAESDIIPSDIVALSENKGVCNMEDWYIDDFEDFVRQENLKTTIISRNNIPVYQTKETNNGE